MIEDKKKYTFPTLERKIVKLGEQDVLVEPYLTDNDQRIILEAYITELFQGGRDSVLNAENSLILSILYTSTDIMTSEETDGKELPIINLNLLFQNQAFIKELLNNIENYREFRRVLDATVSFLQAERNTLGSKLEELYNRAIEFFNEMSDMSPEKMDSIKAQLQELQDSPLVKELIPALSKQDKTE